MTGRFVSALSGISFSQASLTDILREESSAIFRVGTSEAERGKRAQADKQTAKNSNLMEHSSASIIGMV
jgi:hypothetical protein